MLLADGEHGGERSREVCLDGRSLEGQKQKREFTTVRRLRINEAMFPKVGSVAISKLTDYYEVLVAAPVVDCQYSLLLLRFQLSLNSSLLLDIPRLEGMR
jgi:hypothetical protein